MIKSRGLWLVYLLLAAVLVAGGWVGYSYYNKYRTYLTTNNARIDGQQVTISAVSAGQLVNWNGEVGKTYQAGERVGTIQPPLPAPNIQSANYSQLDIKFPINATIVQQTAVKNSFVSPGMPLAYAFDLDRLWVTANIRETDIDAVRIGQAADVYVDAYPGTVLKGKVTKIGLATADIFSLIPGPTESANAAKVRHVIPVTVSLDTYKDLKLVPGMNVTVRIRK